MQSWTAALAICAWKRYILGTDILYWPEVGASSLCRVAEGHSGTGDRRFLTVYFVYFPVSVVMSSPVGPQRGSLIYFVYVSSGDACATSALPALWPRDRRAPRAAGRAALHGARLNVCVVDAGRQHHPLPRPHPAVLPPAARSPCIVCIDSQRPSVGLHPLRFHAPLWQS